MTYEEYLDEVTTLIFEKYGLPEAAAIKLVVDAQDQEFFVRHDDDKNPDHLYSGAPVPTGYVLPRYRKPL